MSDIDPRIHDYERTLEELRTHKTMLIDRIDALVNEFDTLRTMNTKLAKAVNEYAYGEKLLVQTIDQLRSDNARLNIALQTGEQ